MISKRELRLLSALNTQHTISELATTAGISKGQTSEVVDQLETKGLVESHSENQKRIVERSAVQPVQLYQSLSERFPHVDFSELIYGKAIEILYYLDQPHTVSELADKTDNYRNTVNRILKRFQTRGIVSKDAGTYELNEPFDMLAEFAQSLVTNTHLLRVSAPTGSILWESPHEFLLQTTTGIEDERFHLTGPEIFESYGLPLLTTSQRYYWYSTEPPSIEDVVCHMLLIDDSPRYLSYCSLLIAAEGVNADKLEELAKKYQLEHTVQELVAYLETRGRNADESFIAWNEFEQLAQDYEVEL